MRKNFSANLLLLLAGAVAAPVLAQSEPTMHQVYEAAQAGHLAQAQQMMNQVLKDHPQSAKAHYVAAEIDARAGNAAQARQELATAQAIDPAQTFAGAAAIQALQRQIAQEQGTRGFAPHAYAAERGRSSVSWGPILLLFGAIGVVWMIFRRRAAQAQMYRQFPNGPYPNGPQAGAPFPPGNPGYAPGYGPGYGAPGMGSGIAGGLASGLAVGAGVVAGEELAHHFLDGNRTGGVIPEARADELPQNGDMGGNDFGASDSSSWDDGGSFGGGDGGGGGDWT